MFISLLEGQLRHTRALLNGLRHLLDVAVERIVKHQNLVIAFFGQSQFADGDRVAPGPETRSAERTPLQNTSVLHKRTRLIHLALA